MQDRPPDATTRARVGVPPSHAEQRSRIFAPLEPRLRGNDAVETLLTHLRLRRLQQLEQKADPQKSRRGEKEGNGGGGGTATERLAATVGWPGAPSPPVPLVDHGPLPPKQPLSSTYTSHFTLAYRISILVVHSRGPVFLTSSCPASDVAHGPGYGLVVSTMISTSPPRSCLARASSGGARGRRCAPPTRRRNQRHVVARGVKQPRLARAAPPATETVGNLPPRAQLASPCRCARGVGGGRRFALVRGASVAQ